MDLELYESRGKLLAIIAFLAPVGLGGLAAGIFGGLAGGWIIAAVLLPMTAFIVRNFVQAKNPLVSFGPDGLKQRGKEVVPWGEVERLTFVEMLSGNPMGGGRPRAGPAPVRSHFWEVRRVGVKKPKAIGLSQLSGNSYDLADQIEGVIPVPLEREERTASSLRPERHTSELQPH